MLLIGGLLPYKDKRNTQVLHKEKGVAKYSNKKQKSRIEMQLLLRIFRFCNPQRKHRKPSTYVQLPGGRVVNVDKGFIILPGVKSFYKLLNSLLFF
jgi:hypothetical protein